jgi:hypothetical protein
MVQFRKIQIVQFVDGNSGILYFNLKTPKAKNLLQNKMSDKAIVKRFWG